MREKQREQYKYCTKVTNYIALEAQNEPYDRIFDLARFLSYFYVFFMWYRGLSKAEGLSTNSLGPIARNRRTVGGTEVSKIYEEKGLYFVVFQ